jgi:hypothetical protein
MLIVVRLARIPDGANHEWQINESRGRSVGPAMRDGKAIPGLNEMKALLPPVAETCTVHFKVAAGPWHTEATVGKGACAVGGAMGSYIFGEPIAAKNGTSLAVTHNNRDVAMRFVAIDVDGKEHPGGMRTGFGVKDFQQVNLEFDLAPDQIKDFAVQSRPYEEVEIPRIALKRK